MCQADKGTNKKRKKLMPNAIPSIFEVPNPPKAVAPKRKLPTRHSPRKRIKGE